MIDREPIKVLHVIDHLGLGGAQSFLRDLVLSQHESGLVRPTVCCLTEPTRSSQTFRHHGVPILHLNVNRRNYVQIANIPWRLLRIMKKQRYDLVHTHLFVSGVFGRLSALVAGVPTVVHEQRNETEVVGKLGRWIDHILGAKTAAVICVSESTKDFNVNIKGIRRESIWVIPNGINTQLFYSARSQAEHRADLDFFKTSLDNRIVIGVGRLEPEKRFDIFLEAAKVISGRMPNVGFIIVGEGSERGELEMLAKRLGIDASVKFVGARSDVHSLLRSSDVFLLTSDFEGLPLSLLEALAMEVPAVATNVDGTSEVLGEGIGGIVVPRRDPSAVADEVMNLLLDEEQRRNLGRQGRELIEQKYAISLVRERIDDVYRDVLQDTHRSN